MAPRRHGATTVLLVLTCIYTALWDHLLGVSDLGVTRTVVELLMAAVFFGTLVGGALLSLRELHRTRRVLGAVDLSAVLTATDSKIDGTLRERLLDGTVRLVCCEWLRSPAADASLGRDALTGSAIMRRRQDLPPEAFVPCEAAAAALERGDRSVFALSYGWLTASHPDPHGSTPPCAASLTPTLRGSAPVSFGTLHTHPSPSRAKQCASPPDFRRDVDHSSGIVLSVAALDAHRRL